MEKPVPMVESDTNAVLMVESDINAVLMVDEVVYACLLYTSPSPRDRTRSRMPSSA